MGVSFGVWHGEEERETRRVYLLSSELTRYWLMVDLPVPFLPVIKIRGGDIWPSLSEEEVPSSRVDPSLLQAVGMTVATESKSWWGKSCIETGHG